MHLTCQYECADYLVSANEADEGEGDDRCGGRHGKDTGWENIRETSENEKMRPFIINGHIDDFSASLIG